MITGKDNIIQFIRLNNTPFWRIRRSEKSDPIADSGDVVLTIDESVSRLNLIFNILGAGTYFIESWQSENQKKMWCKDTIQILPENFKDVYVGSMQAPQPSQPVQDVQELIRKALDEERTRIKIETLERENLELRQKNKELESEADSVGTRIFQRIEPYLGNIMHGLNGTAPTPGAISGTEKADEAQARLEKAFELWQKNEADVVGMVEKIAQLSNTDKSMYDMARSFLTSNK